MPDWRSGFIQTGAQSAMHESSHDTVKDHHNDCFAWWFGVNKQASTLTCSTAAFFRKRATRKISNVAVLRTALLSLCTAHLCSGRRPGFCPARSSCRASLCRLLNTATG